MTLAALDQSLVFRRAMSAALIALLVSFAGFGVTSALVPADSAVFDIVKFTFALLVIASSFLWCLFDSLTNDFRFGKYMLLLFVFVLPVALVFYFYRSRAPKEATTMLMKAVAFFVLLVLVSAATQVATAHLFGRAI